MKKIILTLICLVTYQYSIADPSKPQSSDSVSCNAKAGEIVKITKDQMLAYAEACKSDSSLGILSFIWGTDAGTTSGTPEGSCKSATYEAYNRPKSACYCYVTEKVSSTSAIGEGNWMCWVGKD